MKSCPIFIIAVLLGFFLSHCQPKPQATPLRITDSAITLPDTIIAAATDSVNTDLQETYWKLVEIMGKPVNTPENAKEIHVKFRKKENNIEGFAGCNGFGGTYELKQGDRILITGLIGTKLACPELDIENAFLEALGTTDNYSINGSRLSLNKARMAPLARLEAVYFH